MDLTDKFITFHAKTAEYIFFSTAHRTFSKTEYILGHRTSLNQFKVKVVPCHLF